VRSDTSDESAFQLAASSGKVSPVDSTTPQFVIYTPKAVAQWYFQFHDAVVDAFRTLGYETTSVDSTEALLATGIKRGIMMILANPDVQELAELSTDVLRSLDFRVIFYEPEPLGRRGDLQARYARFAPAEIWTYSELNVDMLRKRTNYKVRYLPPGYSTVYDYRERSEHPAEDNSHAITLVGVDFQRRLRVLTACNVPIKNKNAWSHQDFANNVVSHHVLINTHKLSRAQSKLMELIPESLTRLGVFKALLSQRMATPAALEMFRLAPLLSSGMRVVSERASDKDEQALAGLIDFAECHKMSALVDRYLAEAKSPEARKSASDRIVSEFKRRFDLTAMIRAALSD
jgi:hypothetical protein